jgi:NADH:ubiquinone oxidoreductase subunit 4 (subunit M)
MIPLIACIVWLGVYPAPVLRRMEGAATKFVSRVNGHVAAPTQPVAEARQ